MNQQAFASFEIIRANGKTEHGFNLYTPAYGETFLGNFRTVRAAAAEAARLAGDNLSSITVL